MTDIVPASEIEGIVGVPRDPLLHYGRAASTEKVFYILHSRECLEVGWDLRLCPYSVALDRGVDPVDWPEDRPVVLTIRDGRLAVGDPRWLS